MPKTTAAYWNTLSSENSERWKPVKGLEGIAEELTLSIDENTGEYTRLAYLPGQKSHTVQHATVGTHNVASVSITSPPTHHPGRRQPQ